MKTLKELMLEKRLTLSVAESVTCGNLQARIGAISGASQFFYGGITAYTLKQKVKHLSVSHKLAEPVDCVSEDVAAEMAIGARRLFGTDLAIATTGYAEPAPDKNITTPFAWIAIADHEKLITRRIDCHNQSRTEVQQHIADIALNALINYLQT